MPNSESIQIYFTEAEYADLKKRLMRIDKSRRRSPFAKPASISQIARELLWERVVEEEKGIEPIDISEKRETKKNGT